MTAVADPTQDLSHLVIDPKDATDVDLLNAFGGLASRIARFPADPNGTQANELHQMRADLDRVRTEVLSRMGGDAVPASAPSVTAACLGGGCELCPGQSNTGKTCTCSCHAAAEVRDFTILSTGFGAWSNIEWDIEWTDGTRETLVPATLPSDLTDAQRARLAAAEKEANAAWS